MIGNGLLNNEIMKTENAIVNITDENGCILESFNKEVNENMKFEDVRDVLRTIINKGGVYFTFSSRNKVNENLVRIGGTMVDLIMIN